MIMADMQSTSPVSEDDMQHSGAEQPEEENFKQMLEASLREQPVLSRGQVVKGMVVSVGGDAVTIDVGAKAEGSINISEFETMGVDVPKSGDEIDVLVQSLGGGGLKVSALAAHRHTLWAGIEQALQENATIPANVVAEVKGGYRVDLGGLTAFMPKSEADISPRTSAETLLGQRCDVAILKLERKPENIVVSRKQPMAQESQEKRQAFFEKASVGDKVSGEVKRLADFGAFVDVGGVDALLHVSDIAWRRLTHPQEMLAVGQEVTAEITKLDAETGKVALSMRALQPDPWQDVSEKYEPGMRLTGTVRRLLDYGAMVELEPGIEGMIHRSELSWTRKDAKPSSVLAEADVVDVAVLGVDPKKRRIALSLKEVMENPWHAWLSAHPVGSRVKGPIKSKTDFGLFVGLDADLDGLVHIGALSWEQKGEEVLGEYKKGQEVECVVLGVEAERQRISLGIKQLAENPFSVFLAGARRGTKVSGEVVEVKQSAVIVSLGEKVQAVLPRREMPRDEPEPKVGDKIEAKVIEVDKRRRKVVLSTQQLHRDEEREAMRSYKKETASQSTPSALALELQRMLLAQADSKTPAKAKPVKATPAKAKKAAKEAKPKASPKRSPATKAKAAGKSGS